MKTEIFSDYQDYEEDTYLVDYTYLGYGRNVEIFTSPPSGISYFHLLNPKKTPYRFVNFEKNKGVILGKQCECAFASRGIGAKKWVCLVELKYCTEDNVHRNVKKAYDQIINTYDSLINQDVLHKDKHRIYFIVSIPDHSHKEPFESHRFTQNKILKFKEETGIQLFGFNEILILNGEILKPLKKDI